MTGFSKGKSKSNDDPLAKFKQRKPSAPSTSDKNYSLKESKNAKLTVDWVETLEICRASLLHGIHFKGYKEVLVQNVKFQT